MIDSTALIAYAYERDENRDIARELLPLFSKNKKRHITDYIALEVTSFLLRKAGFQSAKKTLEEFINSKNVEMIYNNEMTFKATREIFERYPGLSIADANIVFHMQRLGLKEILSFDAGFDKVSGIKRIK